MRAPVVEALVRGKKEAVVPRTKHHHSIYCDKCDRFNRKALTEVTIVRDGKELSCANGDDRYDELEVGTHSNIALQFCMPTKEKFIEIQGWEDSTFEEVSFHLITNERAYTRNVLR